MKKIYLIIQYALFLFSFSAIGQAPNWTVNPSGYDFSMVCTAVLKFSKTESRNQNDKVGAFINDKLVGVASPSVYVGSQDRYEANLTIYSNENNVPVTFKMYNSEQGTTLSAINKITFVSDARLGTVAEPYVISTNKEDAIKPLFLYNNIITPNFDGFNDFLVVEDIGSFTENNLTIYDMNWTKVFHADNYQNNWSGSELKEGEYYLYFTGDYKDYGKATYKVKIKIIK